MRLMSRLLLSILIVSSTTIVVSPRISAESRVVQGRETWQIVLTPRGREFTGAEILPDYSNESNTQKILEASPQRIVIERSVNYEPFESDFPLSGTDRYRNETGLGAYLVPPQSAYIIDLSRKLAAGLTTQLDYVNAVIFEVRERLVWRSSNVIEAEAVLRQGYSVCAGFANAVVELLRAKGIPARVAHVETLPHPSWNAGAHAEVEVYYNDAGWVSYDPQKHHHHGPFPRVFLGSSFDALVWSNNTELWEATRFFRRNSYNVRYVNVDSDVRVTGILSRPQKHDYLTRNDGTGDALPSVYGLVLDEDGNPFDADWIYYNLDGKSNSYDLYSK